MPSKETSALTQASTITGAEIFHLVQGGNSRKASVDNLSARFDGKTARDLVTSAFGSKIGIQIIEEELTLSGGSVASTIQIPNRALCFGVGIRVTQAITGAPSFGVGVSGELTKFGATLGVALGTTSVGAVNPTVFYSPTGLLVTPTSGSFTAGKVRLSIWVVTFLPSTS